MRKTVKIRAYLMCARKRTTPRCILAQHYTRRVLGTTRAEGAQAVTSGAEALVLNPIMISIFCGSDRGDGTGFRVRNSLTVQDFEILECFMDAWVTLKYGTRGAEAIASNPIFLWI